MKPPAGRPAAVMVTVVPAATAPAAVEKVGVVQAVTVVASGPPSVPASGGGPPVWLLPQPTARVQASVPTTASEAKEARLAINADQRPESLRVISRAPSLVLVNMSPVAGSK